MNSSLEVLEFANREHSREKKMQQCLNEERKVKVLIVKSVFQRMISSTFLAPGSAQDAYWSGARRPGGGRQWVLRIMDVEWRHM